ncbi:hypothetical protein [Mycetocola manganoxydans]|uniref:hypothetical protein n=1 Tax=Mycetocola manganoxydans TaxID=699879 RepID=UPI0016018CA1|nr:hypothetical protein [Mycetocola manganoxydans]GHD46456.1 hypothetical protein GCM10008097_16440 [Mycetocola manganoxydans]
MARLLLHPDRLEVILSTAEKTLSLRRENIVVPRSSIRSATLTDDPWIWVRGIRAPGTAIPLTLAVGQWKFHGGKDFLVLKGTKPSVVIDVADEEFSRLIITTKHGMELVSKLQLDVKPTKKSPRVRKTTPQVMPKPKRVPKTDADAPAAAGTPSPTEGLAVVTPDTAVAAAKARAPRKTPTKSAAAKAAAAKLADEAGVTSAEPKPKAPAKSVRPPAATPAKAAKEPKAPAAKKPRAPKATPSTGSPKAAESAKPAPDQPDAV